MLLLSHPRNMRISTVYSQGQKNLKVLIQTTSTPAAGYTVSDLEPEREEEVKSENDWSSVLFE